MKRNITKFGFSSIVVLLVCFVLAVSPAFAGDCPDDRPRPTQQPPVVVPPPVVDPPAKPGQPAAKTTDTTGPSGPNFGPRYCDKNDPRFAEKCPDQARQQVVAAAAPIYGVSAGALTGYDQGDSCIADPKALKTAVGFDAKGNTKWDVNRLNAKDLSLMKNMSQNIPGEFSAVSISHGLCFFAVQITNTAGTNEVRLYNFEMDELARIKNVITPELGNANRLFVTREADGMIVQVMRDGKVVKEFAAGTKPHSILQPDGDVALSFVNPKGNLGLYVSGTVRDTGIFCDYPKWTQDGKFVYCLNIAADQLLKVDSTNNSVSVLPFATVFLQSGKNGQVAVNDAQGLKLTANDITEMKTVSKLFGLYGDWEMGGDDFMSPSILSAWSGTEPKFALNVNQPPLSGEGLKTN